MVNIVSEDFAEKMNICSAEFPPDVDEWVKSGLTPVASECVKPPRVAESRFQMECRAGRDRHGQQETARGQAWFWEKCCGFTWTDELFDDYRIDPDKLRAIGRMGGPAYARTTDRFDLERPKL